MLSRSVVPALPRLLEGRWKWEIAELQHPQQPGEVVAYQVRVSISALGSRHRVRVLQFFGRLHIQAVCCGTTGEPLQIQDSLC